MTVKMSLRYSKFDFKEATRLAYHDACDRLSIPNFDRTKAVISSRRINFLRDFGLKLSLATDLDGLYTNALAAAKDLLRVDFPAIAFYDCTASSTADHHGSNSSSSGGDQARSRTSKSTAGREEPYKYTYDLTASCEQVNIRSVLGR